MTPDGVPGKKNGGLSKQQPTNKPLELLELDEDELLELLDELELPELDELELLLDVDEDDEFEVDDDDELEVDDDDVELELDVESEEPRQQQIPIAPIIHRIFPGLTICIP